MEVVCQCAIALQRREFIQALCTEVVKQPVDLGLANKGQCCRNENMK